MIVAMGVRWRAAIVGEIEEKEWFAVSSVVFKFRGLSCPFALRYGC